MKGKRMRTYLSHSIRGKLGSKCSPDQLKKNCEAAKVIAQAIRNSCPWLDLYVPAEHETFVKKAYDKKYMTEKQVLDVDCDIIAECDILIIHVPAGDELQGGRLVEHDFGINECMPLGLFKTPKEAIDFLTEHHEYDRHYGGEG